METDDKLVSVFSTNTPGEAEVAQEVLEKSGIEARVSHDVSHGIMGMATESPEGMASVLVGEQDVAAAEKILSELTSESGGLTTTETEASQQPLEPEIDSERVIAAWPHCPECDKPRVTVCPICSTSGSEFPRAHENFGIEEEEDDPAVAKEQRLAVVCTTCDEPWLARFLRKCEWCGHDFGAGLKVDPLPQNREPAEPLNPRAMLLMVVMGGLLLGVFAWFWMMGRN